MAPSGLQRRKIEVLVDQVDRLPTLPGIAHHLLKLLLADHPSHRDVQWVVEADATLSARALRLALELGGSSESLTTVDAVFAAVPFDVLAADLLSIETVDHAAIKDLRLDRLWRHILATGMAAQVIANRIGTVGPGEALLAGILHDVGQAALATALPRAYAQVLERAEAEGGDLVAAERAILGIDHAVLGKRLARRWGFSEALQGVIWMHHQANAPVSDRAEGGTLAQLVRLADLVVRQEGFGYQASEQLRESVPEAAERLGLSGAGAEQIGRQIASAFALNAHPVGLEEEPTVDQMWPALAAANARLGRLCRAGHARSTESESHARRADLLMGLNARLASCRSTRDVLAAVAETARESLGVGTCVPYLVSRDGDYVEGLVYRADGTVDEPFLHSGGKGDGLEALLPGAPPTPAAAAVPVRAERIEAWLFAKQGAGLGPGPFYTAPMVVEGRKVGAIVFVPRAGKGELSPRDSAELAAVASLAGVALTRVQAEADLVALSEELAEANRGLQAAEGERLEQRNVASLSEMAAGAAHEINNPLAIISGRAQQLAADEQSPAHRELLKTIILQASRISDIIADLRLFARPPAPKFQDVDPVALAGQVVAEIRAQLGGTAGRLRLDAPQVAAAIRVDPDQVGSALREVVQNAIQACSDGKGGDVTIGVQTVGDSGAVRLVVTDTGPGMDPQVRARAFDPFFCGDKAGRHRGLGLPKAYRTVRANGGQMALESAPGRGTIVRMTFGASKAAKPK